MTSATTGPGPGPAKPSGYTGRTIARCRVGDRLGRGATSHVFRALYEPLNKDIALKILATKDASAEGSRDRFLSEARAVAKLNHENIVKVLDVVEDQGLLCILMELVNGPTLQDRLDDEDVLPPRQAFRIAGQIARALEAAHEEKLVHRDVKPANVILAGKRGEETVKVVDFGLAAQQEMNRVGTPLFMSPEAAQGKRIDEKSDVYALGICLYRMLTGVLPFTGATVKEILAAQVNAELVPPSVQRPQLTKAYDDLLKRLLVKSKGYRPTAEEAADLLEDVADDLEEREVGVRRVRKRKKKRAPPKAKPVNPAIWAGLAIAGLLVVGLYIAFSGGSRPPAESAGNASVDKRPPVPVPVEPSKLAFDAVDAWVGAHPADFKEAARRWADVAQRFPGTPSGTAADVRAAEAKAAVDKEKASVSTTPPPPPPIRKEDPAVKYAKLVAAEKAFDWVLATTIADGFGDENPPDMSGKEFEQKVARIQYLQENFVARMDAGLHRWTKPISAKDVFSFSDAKAGETVLFAKSSGLVVTDGKEQRNVAWSLAKPEAFFDRTVFFDKVLDTGTFEDACVLAALALELGQPATKVKRCVDSARGQTGNDAQAEKREATVRSLFGE